MVANYFNIQLNHSQMKTVKQSHRVNSREHLKELLSGKYKYFTLEFDGCTIYHDGTTQLVYESYRIPNKLKKELMDEIPIIKDAKRLLIFEDYKQVKKYLRINLDRSLPRHRSTWLPIIIAMASSDSCLYYGHELMKYWRDAKRNKDKEAKSFYALAEHWMILFNYCKEIREQFSQL